VKLRKKQTGLNVGMEGRPPKKPLVSLTSVVYLLVLAGLFLYVARFVAVRVFTVDGRGRVELTRVYVGAGNEGVVRDLLVSEREKVSAGQPVAVLSLEPVDERLRDTTTPIQRDILGTESDLARMRSRRRLLRGRLAEKKRRLDRILAREHIERSLEVRLFDDTEASRLARDVEELKFKVSELNAEISHEKQYLQKLKRAAEDIPAPESPATEAVLTSPENGTVVGIFKGYKDFLSKEEVLMAVVPTGAKVRVRGNFDADDLEHLDPGRKATLSFPDGRELEAEIGKIYAASSRLRADERNTMQDLPSRVEVVVLPGNRQDYLFWERYNNMDIGIRVRREWIDFSF
jgi:multidrug resistance efflux pump